MTKANSASAAHNERGLQRALASVAALSLIPLWASGALGQALSLGVTLAFVAALILLMLSVTTHRLDRLMRIVFIVAATSLSLFAADLALRILGGSRVYYRAHSELLRKDTAFPSLNRYVPNARISRDTFGDLAAISGVPTHREVREERFFTDEYGFRNSREELKPPYDVIVLGDSFGMGLSASQDEHWAALLNQEGHSVYNLSMPSTCSAHEAARISQEVARLPLAPKTTFIALVYSGNDLEECSKSVNEILAEGPQSAWKQALTWLEDYRSRSPLRQLGMRLVYRFLFSDPVIEARSIPAIGEVLFYKPHDKAARATQATVEKSDNFKNLTESLLTIRTIADTHHANLLVVLIPSKEEVYNWLLHGSRAWEGTETSSGFSQAVLAVCEKNRLTCINLKSPFVEEAKTAFDRGGLLWWRDDSHWNRDGHQLTKRIINRALQER